MKKSSKMMKWCFSMLLMTVMVLSMLPVTPAHAAKYDEGLDPLGQVDYRNDSDWKSVPEDDSDLRSLPLTDVCYDEITCRGGNSNQIYLYETKDHYYIIDAYHEEEESEFVLYKKNEREVVVVSTKAGIGGRFLLKNGSLYLLDGSAETEEINFEYGDLTYNVQVEKGKELPKISKLPTNNDSYAIEVPSGTSILLDGEKKEGGKTYYIPETGKENEKQAAKDEVNGAADKEKQEIDKIPNLSDKEKADAKKEIADAASNAGTKIDAATTKKEINDAISNAQKTMDDAVSKADKISKDKQLAESFIKDNLTDANGKIITTVTEKNIINILNVKEKWDSLS